MVGLLSTKRFGRGNPEAVEYLLDEGAEMNVRTGVDEQETGGSPLWIARKYLGNFHPITMLLESRGAKEYRPEPHVEL